jgi:hypothetical protein
VIRREGSYKIDDVAAELLVIFYLLPPLQAQEVLSRRTQIKNARLSGRASFDL